jgi:hypothetical protein
MSRPLPPFLLLAALAAAPPPASALPAAECPSESFGAGVTLAETTPIASLLGHPEQYLDRTVAVEGQVTEVCAKAGCWLEVAAAQGDARIRVKVKDGEIVFPQWARGKTAVAEGTLEKLELTREQYVQQAEHEAHEQGRDFDPATVAGEGPFVVHRIRGTGARVCR